MFDLLSLMETPAMPSTPAPAPVPAPAPAPVAAVIFSAPPPVDPAQMARNRAAYREREAAREAERAAFLDIARPRFPAWAKAVILAELIADESDTMTDYHGGRTVR
jgi:monoamine oxidase